MGLGLRIVLALVSDALAPHAKAAGIDREPSTWDRPSDHAPVWVELGWPRVWRGDRTEAQPATNTPSISTSSSRRQMSPRR